MSVRLEQDDVTKVARKEGKKEIRKETGRPSNHTHLVTLKQLLHALLQGTSSFVESLLSTKPATMEKRLKNEKGGCGGGGGGGRGEKGRRDNVEVVVVVEEGKEEEEEGWKKDGGAEW